MKTLRRSIIALLLVVPAAAAAFWLGPALSAQGKKPGSPEPELPPGIIRVTGFGERAAWSPHDRRVAFMGKSFKDAFEIDLGPRMTASPSTPPATTSRPASAMGSSS